MSSPSTMLVVSATGSGLKRTIPALESSKVVRVVAAQGRSKEKLTQLANRYQGITVSEDLERLFRDTNPDIVYIASPPFLHKDQIANVVKYGKPIICEKPLALTIKDSVEIYRLVKSRKLPFMLAHHLRHQTSLKEVRNALSSGRLGKVKGAHFQWNFMLNRATPNALWKLSPRIGSTNAFLDAGVHAIDLAIYLFGKPRMVFAHGYCEIIDQYFDSVSCQLLYDGFSVFLSASQTQSTLGNNLNVYCEYGYIFAKDAFSEKSIAQVIEESEKNGITTRQFEEINLYRSEVEAFAVATSGNDTREFTGTSIDEALEASCVLDAIQRSLLSHHVEPVLALEEVLSEHA